MQTQLSIDRTLARHYYPIFLLVGLWAIVLLLLLTCFIMSETEPSLPGTLYPTVVTSIMILWLAFETFRPRTRKAYKQEKFVREANKALQKELQTRKFPVISAEWAQAIIAEPYTGHASSDMQLQLVVGLDDSEVMFALSREEAERLGVTTGQVPKSVGFPTASYESCSGKLRLYIREALFEL